MFRVHILKVETDSTSLARLTLTTAPLSLFFFRLVRL